MKGLKEIFPESRRRICDVHYCRNFSKDFLGELLQYTFTCNFMQFHPLAISFSKGLFTCNITGAKLHLLFWTACNAYTKHVFTRSMEAIKRESKRAYEWLMDEPVEHWARYTFDPEVKCPDNTCLLYTSPSPRD